MHLQIKMDQKSFSLRRLVLKEKCSSFSSIQKPLMVECGRVKTSPTALVYTHTTTQARINRRKVFVEPMLAVQRVNTNTINFVISFVFKYKIYQPTVNLQLIIEFNIYQSLFNYLETLYTKNSTFLIQWWALEMLF
ncbi:Hypothetical_protein [Hexamita inflata]|uniref:Hypothetical_protein n=1 Tax=Hexamita inflata TaxID=28002 RepID=A0AA86NAM0_9EUKA|nr:Hypothetical protein HINF_LOCUS3852 [Hexamita inflata]